MVKWQWVLSLFFPILWKYPIACVCTAAKMHFYALKMAGKTMKIEAVFFFYYVQGTIIEHICTLMHVWVSILWKQKVCRTHQIDCFYSKLSILTNRSKQLKSTGVEYTVEKNNPLLSKYCSVENSLKTFKIHDINMKVQQLYL